ncbi:CHAP domain-containing protein [Streptomyces sp. NPDC047014]|uniref:CHAP domain-containing protein n=1 Tax=Streptomyces sp. NPDC047014 TaxID=3155736 RepID=UPI00340F819A
MSEQPYDRRRALRLGLGAAAGAAAYSLLGPALRASAGSGDNYPEPWRSAALGAMTDTWRFSTRYCTSWVAFALKDRNGYDMRHIGHAKDWGPNAGALGITVDMNPAPGAAAWWAGASWNGGYGHVAWVESVNGDTVMIQDYNHNGKGDHDRRPITRGSVSGYIHYKDLDASSGGGSPVPAIPQIFQVKRTTDPSGVRQVYACTNTAVTEGWWIPGGDGVHLHEVIKIDQQNIVGFDKVNLPGGTQAVYTATSDGVRETWWKPDGSSGGGQIVSGLSGVKGVFAHNTVENGQFVHHLYILAGDGPYEAWWKDGGDGVHVSRLTTINGGKTFTMAVAPDGTLQLYVATPTWVYEVWWTPGSNNVRTGTVINVSQGDIRQLTKAETLPDGTQRLYTTTSSTVWESRWGGGLSGIRTTAKVVGQNNAVMSRKLVTDGADQLYLATGAKVQEYWWTSGNSGGGTLIDIAQGNIGAIDKTSDGPTQQLYTAAGQWIHETWWGNGTGPTTTGLFSVSH